jgi:integrase
MKTWLFQDHRQKLKLGDKCPWSVGYYSDGKRRSEVVGSRSKAEKFALKKGGELAAGLHVDMSRKGWSEFEDELETKVLAGMEPGTREVTSVSLNHFTRIIQPGKLRNIDSRTIAQFVAKRRQEAKYRTDDESAADCPRVSAATVNRDLRVIRMALRKAHRWGYLPTVPEFEFLREPGKLAVYVTPEHFLKLYAASKNAKRPAEDLPFPASDWWAGLFVFLYMTGWRIAQTMALRWEDVDLEAGTVLSRAANNKARRDTFIRLHPLVIDHLRRLRSFEREVFPWEHGRRALFADLASLQDGIDAKPIGGKARYTFHDFRRAFATMNAANLTPDALQALMQHKDYQTTQRYINMARQLDAAVANLHVPALPALAVAT